MCCGGHNHYNNQKNIAEENKDQNMRKHDHENHESHQSHGGHGGGCCGGPMGGMWMYFFIALVVIFIISRFLGR